MTMTEFRVGPLAKDPVVPLYDTTPVATLASEPVVPLYQHAAPLAAPISYKEPIYEKEKTLLQYPSPPDSNDYLENAGGRRGSVKDEVFGEITEGKGPNYRNVRLGYVNPFNHDNLT